MGHLRQRFGVEESAEPAHHERAAAGLRLEGDAPSGKGRGRPRANRAACPSSQVREGGAVSRFGTLCTFNEGSGIKGGVVLIHAGGQSWSWSEVLLSPIGGKGSEHRVGGRRCRCTTTARLGAFGKGRPTALEAPPTSCDEAVARAEAAHTCARRG